MPRRLLRLFAAPERPAAAALPKPAPAPPSPAQTASRNYARMHRAAMARERRAIDGH